MFRTFSVILILAAFALQSFNRAFIVVDYFANTTSFLKKCENKARPQMHCNGKCVMLKKLKEAEKQEQQAPERKWQFQTELFSQQSFLSSAESDLISVSNFIYPRIRSFVTDGFNRAVFHPPAFNA